MQADRNLEESSISQIRITAELQTGISNFLQAPSHQKRLACQILRTAHNADVVDSHAGRSFLNQQQNLTSWCLWSEIVLSHDAQTEHPAGALSR